MKRINIFVLYLTSICLFPIFSFGASISGGELTYEYVSAGTYEFTLTLYKDCVPVDPLPLVVSIEVENTCGGVFTPVFLNSQGPTAGEDVSQICPASLPDSDCDPSGTGTVRSMRKYIYTGTSTILAPCDAYTFSYTDCCRDEALNVTGGTVNEYYIEATLNSIVAPENSSPVFTSDPNVYVCAGSDVHYNFGVIDGDLDSLSYSLVSAYKTDKASPLVYEFGFTATEPIPTIVINTVSGELVFTTPATLGSYIVVVEVSEYNSAKEEIGSVMRDISLVAIDCGVNNIPTPAVSVTNVIDIPVASPVVTSATGPYEITTALGAHLSFDIEFTDLDVADNLIITDNSDLQLLPFGVSSSNTVGNKVTIDWAVPFTGLVPYHNIVTFQVNDGACPITGNNSISVDIIVPPQVLHGTFTSTPNSCGGVSDATVIVQTIGGIGPFLYTWSGDGINSTNNATITNVPKTRIFLTIKDNGNPDNTSNFWNGSYNIPGPDEFSIQPNVVDDDCTIIPNGSINLTVLTSDGGPGDYSYSWLPGGETTKDLSNLLGGVTYTVEVNDNPTGCKQSKDVLVKKPTSANITIESVVPVSCGVGTSDGSIEISAIPICGLSGADCTTPIFSTIGTGTEFNDPATGDFPALYGNKYKSARHQMLFTAKELADAGVLPGTISSLAFDIKAVGATLDFSDFSIKIGCTTDDDLKGPPITGLIAVLIPKNITIAVGLNTYTFDDNYYWDGISNLVVEVCFTNIAAIPLGNSATYYTQTTNASVAYFYSDDISACTSTDTIATSNQRPNIQFGNCQVDYTYTWSPEPAAMQGSTPFVNNLTAQEYTVTITDGACATVEVIDVGFNVVIDPTINIVQGPQCHGDAISELNVTTAGGTQLTYAWSHDPLATTATITGLTAGIYTVTVTDGVLGCTEEETVELIDPPGIDITIDETGVIVCDEDEAAILTATITGSAGPFSYYWDTIPAGGVALSTSAELANISIGDYSVAVYDESTFCAYTENYTVSNPLGYMVVYGTTPPSCPGLADGSITINIVGPTYLMLNNTK